NVHAVQRGETEAAEGHYAHVPSMLEDIRSGRRTEVDFITGSLVREAARAGVDVPLHRAMYRLVSARGAAGGVPSAFGGGRRRRAPPGGSRRRPGGVRVSVTLLGRRWQRRQAGGAQDSAAGTDKRRPRGILPSSGVSLRRSPAPSGGSRRRPGA